MMAIAHTGELKRDIDYCILANIKSHFIYIILVIIQLCKQGQRKAWRIPSPKNFKVKGQGHWVKFLPHNIRVNTLESTSFNGF
jgi:hypothetical protein